jgi:transposase
MAPRLDRSPHRGICVGLARLYSARTRQHHRVDCKYLLRPLAKHYPRHSGTQSRFSPEVRERAVRIVFEHAQDRASQWATITSIAEKIGCAAETLRSWVRQAERDAGRRPGLTTDERARFKQLERENIELRRANEILRLASAYFAKAELDRRA